MRPWGRVVRIPHYIRAALFLHNSTMVNLSTGDLGLEIDYGRSKPGDVLQRWEYEHGGRGVRQDRKVVTNPLNYETLSTGWYWLRQGVPQAVFAEMFPDLMNFPHQNWID